MTKKKYETPVAEVVLLKANISVMIADSNHDGGLGGHAPERRVPAF